tara:strand:- start:536 stop:763 length:228 start_codon:yes stop_codon:yes gene_type:complete
MISKLSKSLPTGAFVVFAKHYRDQPNKVKFIADFSNCPQVTVSIQKWFTDVLLSSNGTIEYTKTSGSTATIISTF